MNEPRLNAGAVTAWRLKSGKVGFAKDADIEKLLKAVVGARS